MQNLAGSEVIRKLLLLEAPAPDQQDVVLLADAGEEAVAHPEARRAVGGLLRRRGQREREPADVVLGGHANARSGGLGLALDALVRRGQRAQERGGELARMGGYGHVVGGDLEGRGAQGVR